MSSRIIAHQADKAESVQQADRHGRARDTAQRCAHLFVMRCTSFASADLKAGCEEVQRSVGWMRCVSSSLAMAVSSFVRWRWLVAWPNRDATALLEMAARGATDLVISS